MKQFYLLILLIASLSFNLSVQARTEGANAATTVRFGTAQTITFPAIPTQVTGRADFVPTVSASSGLQVTLSIPVANSNVATIVNGKIHIVGAGTATVTATQAGDGTYDAATPVSQTFTVISAQTITFAAIPTQIVGRVDFASNATASSTLPVALASSNPSVATIVNGLIHIVGAGQSTITASQSGSATFDAAPNVTQSLTVVNLTLTSTLGTLPYSNMDIPLASNAVAPATITYTSSDPTVATIVNNQVHIVKLGTVNITANQVANANYIATNSAPVALTIVKGSQVIAFPPIAGQIIGRADFSPGATSNSGLPVSYSVATAPATGVASIVNNQIHLLGGAGTVTVTASQAGNTLFNAAANVQQIFTVAPLSILTSGFTGTSPNFTATFSPVDLSLATNAPDDASIVYTSSAPAVATIVNNAIHFVTPGTFSVTASQPASDLYAASSSPAINFTVSKAPQTITIPAIPKQIVGRLDFDPGAGSSSGLPLAYSISTVPATGVASLVNNKIHIDGPGQVTIKADQAGDAFYNAAPQASLTFAVEVLVINTVLGNKTYSPTDLALANNSVSPASITYSSSDPTVASIINGNQIHYVGTGTTNIIASQASNSFFSIVNSAPVALTVTAGAAQTIAFSAVPDMVLGKKDFSPAIASSGLPITYTSSDPNVATIVNGKIHVIATTATPTTKVTITANQSGNALFNAAPVVSQSFAVLPATLTITTVPTGAGYAFNPNSSADIALATNAPSGVVVTYSTDNPAIATIFAGKLHMLTPGNVNVIASVADQLNSGPMTSAPVLFKINQVASPTITFGAMSRAYTTADFDPAATSSVINTAFNPIVYSVPTNQTLVSVVDNRIHFLPDALKGTYPKTVQVTATLPAAPGKYGAASANATLTITGGPAALVFNDFSKAISNADFDPLASTAIATSTYSDVNSPILFSIAAADSKYAVIVANKIRYISPTPTGAPINVTATQVIQVPATATAATTLTLSKIAKLTITQAVITNPTAFGSKAVNTADYSPTPSSNPNFATTYGGIPMTYTSSDETVVSIVNNLLHFNNVGVVTITASQGGTTATAAAGGPPANLSAILTVVPVSPPGPSVISFPSTFTASRAFSPIDFAPLATSAVADPPITYTSSNPAVATIVDGQVHMTGIGNTVITASQPGFTDVSKPLAITAPAIVLGTASGNFWAGNSAGNVNKTFSTADIAFGGITSSLADPLVYTSSNPEVATIVSGQLHCTGMGQTQITVSQPNTGTSAYDSPVPQTMLVTITQPVITFANLARAYSETDIAGTATSTVTTVPITYSSNNPSVVSIVSNQLHFNGLGTATITAAQAAPAVGAGSFILAPQSKQQQLTVSIKMPSTLATYGDPDFSPAVTLNGLQPTYLSATTATATVVNGGTQIHIVAPGTSSITASQTGDVNTGPTPNAVGVLTVQKAPLIVKVDNYTRFYGEADPVVFPLTYTGFTKVFGTATLDDASSLSTQPSTFNLAIPLGENRTGKTVPPGTYPAALVPGLGASANYALTYLPGDLTVLAAPQTLSFSTLPTKQFGDADFDPQAKTTGDPVVYTSSDPSIATIVNGKVHIVAVGTVTITATLTPTSGNYTGSATLSQTLTINKGPQTVTVGTVPVLKVNGAGYTLNVQSSSGLPLTFKVNDPRIVSVNGLVLSGKNIGNTTITVSQAGNGTYLPLEPVNVFVKVESSDNELIHVNQAMSPDGDGLNDVLIIDGIKDYPANHVTIVNRNGTKVFNVDNYNNTDNVFRGKAGKGGENLPEGSYYYVIEYRVSGEWLRKTGYIVVKY